MTMMMIAMILMLVMMVILMIMMTKITKKYTNIMTLQQKCTNCNDFYLMKKGAPVKKTSLYLRHLKFPTGIEFSQLVNSLQSKSLELGTFSFFIFFHIDITFKLPNNQLTHFETRDNHLMKVNFWGVALSFSHPPGKV